MQGLSRGGDLAANSRRRHPPRSSSDLVLSDDTIVSHVPPRSTLGVPCTVVELTSVLYEANKELGIPQVNCKPAVNSFQGEKLTSPSR